VQAHERIEDQEGRAQLGNGKLIMGRAEAIPPEPPSLARQTWRVTRGEVEVASILLVGQSPRLPPSNSTSLFVAPSVYGNTAPVTTATRKTRFRLAG